MAAAVPPPRKGGKLPPKLPLSAFTGNSVTNPQSPFKLPPDPASVHPTTVIDANVTSDVEKWKEGAGILKDRAKSVVLSLKKGSTDDGLVGEDAFKQAETADAAGAPPISAVIAPYPLSSGAGSNLPNFITASKFPVALSSTYKRDPALSAGISWALNNGHVVEIEIDWTAEDAEIEANWEGLEEIIGKGAEGATTSPKKPIVISNLLPPPHSLLIPIVKLLAHPTYIAYQSHIGSLAFVENVYLKFIPPSWNDPTPPSPAPGTQSFKDAQQGQISGEAKDEWKRRVKMFLGPAMDAFGFSRIIFGTSPSASSSSTSTPNDWYAIAREAIAELALEQGDIDAIFGGNAQTVYSK